VATTLGSEDDVLVAFCEERAISCVRGSSDDVLSRFHKAALEFRADTVVRVTSDCPLVDPTLTAEIVDEFERTQRYDYLSNTTTRRTFPRGLDVEIFTVAALNEADKDATQPYEREHVTPYIKERPDRFRCGDFVNASDESRHRWTLDTEDDYALLTKIFESGVGDRPGSTWTDVLEYVNANPGLQDINRHVHQKSVRA